MKLIFEYRDGTRQEYENESLILSYIEEFNKYDDPVKFDLDTSYSSVGIVNTLFNNIMYRYITKELTKITVKLDSQLFAFNIDSELRYRITFHNKTLKEILFIPKTSMIRG